METIRIEYVFLDRTTFPELECEDADMNPDRTYVLKSAASSRKHKLKKNILVKMFEHYDADFFK